MFKFGKKKEDKKEQKKEEPVATNTDSVLWGTTLKEAARRSDPVNWAVPSPITKAIQYIESQEKFMQSEGIYRIPGSGIKVQAYRAQFDKGEDVTIGANSPWEVDEATSVLINFLKNMQDSLFGKKKEDLMYAVSSNDLSAMRDILGTLPLENRETLRALIVHLAKLATYKDKTKMDVSNLAMCFGPSFATIFPPMISNSTTIIPETIVFGVPLETAAKRSSSLVPSPISVSIDFIEKNGLGEKHLYQESGSVAKILEYRYKFNSGEKVEYQKGDVHCATGIINSFFRDTDSLFPKELKEQFMAVKDLGSDDEKVNTLKNLLGQLPKVNYETIKAVALHWNKVVSTIGIPVQILADCFGKSYSVIFPPIITLSKHLF